MTLAPIVCFHHDKRTHNLIETLVFRDYAELGEWLDKQETYVELVFQPREEVIDVRHSMDHCPGCGLKVRDFEEGGFENSTGQRGHFECVPHLYP
jgi:hypothetical protein